MHFIKSHTPVFHAVLFVLLIALGGQAPAAAGPALYAEPDAAVDALIAALNAHDKAALLVVLGAEAAELAGSGDEAADKSERDAFVEAYARKHALTPAEQGEGFVLQIGEKEWPFPIPLRK